MKAKQIRDMTVEEIEQQLETLKEELFKIRSEAVTGRLERPHRLKIIKRDIARCHTIVKEKSGE